MRIGQAGPKGKGAFAAAPIRAAAKVATFGGTPKWIWKVPKQVWPHTFQVDYDRYVVPRRSSAAWAINHSCEPNCLIRGRSIVAARRIETGEELTFDYSTDVDWPDFAMVCKCGSSGCRRVVRAYRYLPERLRLRYGRNVADYIWKRYGDSANTRLVRKAR